MSSNIEIVTKVSVTEEQIDNLLCSWRESGHSDWFDRIRVTTPATEPTEYIHEIPLRGGELAVLVERKWYSLDKAALERGLQTMAEKYPKVFQQIVDENDDALTADCFVQCCLFGEERYC